MELQSWLGTHWFVLLQSAGIIGGLFITSAALRLNFKERRNSNLIAITQHHRDIWSHFYQWPELSRIRHRSVDLNKNPVTPREELFVSMVVLHLNSAYRAMKDGLLLQPDALEKDVRQFFSLPIPYSVWSKLKQLQDAEFVTFVDSTFLVNEPDDADGVF